MFSCEFCEISKNTFYYRTHLVAAFSAANFSFTFVIFFTVNLKSLTMVLTRIQKESMSRDKFVEKLLKLLDVSSKLSAPIWIGFFNIRKRLFCAIMMGYE